MCNKSRGRKQDSMTIEEIKRRQELRRLIELREEAKAAGLSFEEYTALIKPQ